jgi:glycosyltransferase involved in cell wall biosynthesis
VKNKVRVLHICHDLSIGGVEEAIRSYTHDSTTNISFEVITIDSKYNSLPQNRNTRVAYGGKGLNNPISFYRCLKFLLTHKADIVIFSLWRSTLLGLLAKPFKRAKFVCFLHNESYKNFIDAWIHKISIRNFDHIFVDSECTQRSLVPENKNTNTSIISFKTKKLSPLGANKSYNFIYWGRIAKQKRIDRLLKFMTHLKNTITEAHLTLIGPEEYNFDYSLADNFSHHGPKTFDEIKRIATSSSFFILTSDHEGMAMSVVEAMEMGLVPVVTPVGQIPHYCKDKNNAIFLNFDDIDSWDETIHFIQKLTKTDYTRMSNLARGTWTNTLSYTDSINKAIINIKDQQPNQTTFSS